MTQAEIASVAFAKLGGNDVSGFDAFSCVVGATPSFYVPFISNRLLQTALGYRRSATPLVG